MEDRSFNLPRQARYTHTCEKTVLKLNAFSAAAATDWKFCDAYVTAAANHTFERDPHKGWTQSDGCELRKRSEAPTVFSYCSKCFAKTGSGPHSDLYIYICICDSNHSETRAGMLMQTTPSLLSAMIPLWYAMTGWASAKGRTTTCTCHAGMARGTTRTRQVAATTRSVLQRRGRTAGCCRLAAASITPPPSACAPL